MGLTDKFDRNRRKQTGKIGQEVGADSSENTNYATPGHIRNLSFVMLDGTRQFFSYADLTSCVFQPSKNKMILNFREFYNVTISGKNLDLLYKNLLSQRQYEIICEETRYEGIKGGKEKIFVTEIEITKLED